MAEITGTPKVKVNVASNNLQRQIIVLDGVPGLVATSVENIGVIQKVYNLPDAVEKGYTLEAEPFLYAQIEQFYNEIGGSFELHVYGVEDTMTLQQMCTSSNANGIKKLTTFSQGKVNLIGIARNPSNLYDPGDGYLDVDVQNAFTALKTLGQYHQGINRPIRVLIEGRVNDQSEEPYEPNTAANGFGGTVLGNDLPDGSGAIGLALARACKYPAHVKLGDGQNGPLSITKGYIGTKAIEDYFPEELDALTDAGYIILHTRDGSAGYYFSVDNMATNDDYKSLARGRIIDKAQRIATAAANPFLETNVRVDANGNVNASDAKYLEEVIKAQLNTKMAGQISGVDVIIPTDQDVINTSTLNIQVKIQPLGYLTWFTINLGLTKTL